MNCKCLDNIRVILKKKHDTNAIILETNYDISDFNATEGYAGLPYQYADSTRTRWGWGGRRILKTFYKKSHVLFIYCPFCGKIIDT